MHLCENMDNKALDDTSIFKSGATKYDNQKDEERYKLLKGFGTPVRDRIIRDIQEEKKFSDEECPICLDIVEQGVFTKCGHIFCRECTHGVSTCPLCRLPLDQSELVNIAQIETDEPFQIEKIKFTVSKTQENVTAKQQGWMPSSKLRTLLKILDEIRRNDKTDKVIVFSQFTSMLDLLEIPLLKTKIILCVMTAE
eukprot:UN27621